MQAITDISNKILTNIVLSSIKGFVNQVLLSFPVNVFLVFIVLAILVCRLLGLRVNQKEVTKVKQEVNVMKSKQGLEALRKQLKEVGEQINQMGIKFGVHAHQNTVASSDHKEANQLTQFLQTVKNSSNVEKVTKKIRNSTVDILKEFQTLPQSSNSKLN